MNSSCFLLLSTLPLLTGGKQNMSGTSIDLLCHQSHIPRELAPFKRFGVLQRNRAILDYGKKEKVTCIKLKKVSQSRENGILEPRRSSLPLTPALYKRPPDIDLSNSINQDGLTSRHQPPKGMQCAEQIRKRKRRTEQQVRRRCLIHSYRSSLYSFFSPKKNQSDEVIGQTKTRALF